MQFADDVYLFPKLENLIGGKPLSHIEQTYEDCIVLWEKVVHFLKVLIRVETRYCHELAAVLDAFGLVVGFIQHAEVHGRDEGIKVPSVCHHAGAIGLLLSIWDV